MYWRNLPISLVMVSFALVGYSQQQKPTIKPTSPQYTDPTSGAEMYRTYCAVCHGLAGKGNGPAAPALKQALPDLTLLSKKSGGQFPSFRVSNIIQGDAEITAHGSKEMPMWGDVFRSLRRDELVVKLRVHNLADYIESLQEK
jgi:mono/diheme cytochrome c family protein